MTKPDYSARKRGEPTMPSLVITVTLLAQKIMERHGACLKIGLERKDI